MSAPLPPLGHTAGTIYHGGDADGDDGDDPRNPKRLPSAHEVDAPPGAGSRMNKDRRHRRRLEGAPNISEPCPVCPKRFRSSKALHGHMRMHPERDWRGVLPPAQRQQKKRSQEEEAALSLLILSEGPHANHRSVKGRYATGRGQRKNASCKGEGSKKVKKQKHKGKKKLEEEPATEKEPCPVCPKRFQSAKALHGHMRMHPERDWRGVLPPAQRQQKKRSQEEEAALSLIILSEGPNAGPRPEFDIVHFVDGLYV